MVPRTVRVRLNRGGDRTVNWAQHMIAVTPTARRIGGGTAYVEPLLAAGRTRTDALRLLRRRLTDVVFRALLVSERRQVPPAAANQATAA